MVKGPTGAVISLLLDAGWDPREAKLWVRPAGGGDDTVDWHLPGSDDPDAQDFDVTAVLDDFVGDFRACMWRTASRYEHGEGFADSADVLMVGKEQQRLMRAGDVDIWSQNMVVVTGGRWPRDRQIRQGYEAQAACPRCGR